MQGGPGADAGPADGAGVAGLFRLVEYDPDTHIHTSCLKKTAGMLPRFSVYPSFVMMTSFAPLSPPHQRGLASKYTVRISVSR